jgi:hypothetical protein
VDSGWTPYTDGRWAWEPYYGWTWVGYEPWGWAPYHYGRWFCRNNVWSWWPGPVWGVGVGYRPVWAPAYVSFFGFGYGHHGFSFGIGFGFGSIGWLATGPCDPYVPWYGRAGYGRWGYYNHYNQVNVNHITSINNVNNITNLRNVTGVQNAMPALSSRANGFSNLQALQRGDAQMARGLNMVSSDRFGQGSLRGAIQHPTASSLGEGRVVTGGLPVVPTKASLSPSGRSVNPSAIPRSSSQQTFAGRQAAARPQAFNQSASQVQQMVQNHNPQVPMSQNRVGATATGMNPGSSSTRMLQGTNSRVSGTAAPSSTGSLNSGRHFETVPGANGRSEIVEQHPGQTQQSWQRPGSPSTQGVQSGQSAGARSDRPAYAQQAPSRSGFATQNGAGNGGWRRFSGSPSSQGQMGPSTSRPSSSWQQYQSRPGTQTPSGNSLGQSGNSGWGRFSGGSGRPPLDLRSPIVTQRAPSYGPGYSPRYNAPPSNYGGNPYSQPRSGGYNAPSRSFGGYSAPPSRGGSGSGGFSSGGHSSGSSGHSGGSGGHSRR